MNLAQLSIKRPIFMNSIILMVMAVGAISFKSLSVDLYPEVNIPVVSVTTVYQGAGPSEIETLISKPIEEEISAISGMKRLTSKSLEGVSQVVAEFNQGVDVKYAEQQVRDKVGVAKAKIPREAKEPLIRKMDPSDQPILTLAVSGKLSEAKMFDLADQMIKPRLEQVDNVGSIEILGGRKREIHVVLDRSKLKARETSVSQVAAQLASSGENIPGGKVNRGDQETVYRSLGEFQNVNEISDTLVSLYGNEVSTRVSDVGKVLDTLEDEKTRAYVNGKKSLFIDVYRQSGSNTIAVVQGIIKKMNQMKPELQKMEGAPELQVLRDSSKNIKDNVDDVYETIIIGIILTVVTVYFFLGSARSTLITGLSLPISLVGSFILIAWAGFSINVISLLALTLAIGLLIDDAIVVIENIYRRMEGGEDAQTASHRGTAEIQMAVFAITLVVISVFAPVAFTKGTVGQFLKQFGLTIAFSMAISLFVALAVIPMLTAYFAEPEHHSEKKGVLGFLLKKFDHLQTGLENQYAKFLAFSLKRPILVILASLLVFGGSIVSIMSVPGNFIPEQDSGDITVALDLPPGTNLDGMEKVAFQVDQKVHANSEVRFTTLTVGGKNNEANKAELYVKLKKGKERGNIKTSAFKERLRTQLREYSFANPIVTDWDSSGGAKTQPVTLNLIGTDQTQLEQYVAKLLERLKKDPRLTDLDSTYRPGKPELQIRVKKDAVRVFGIHSGTMGQEIRAQVEGMTPAKFREQGREYDVRVRLTPEQRDLNKNLKKIEVPNVNGRLVRLTDVANIKETVGAAAIDRQNRGRYIQVTAGLKTGAGLSEVIRDITQILEGEMQLPAGMRYSFAGDSESFQEMAESMLLALGFALLFIYLILASLYESFITPITVLIALPLALCGAFLALYVTGESLNLLAILGIFLLLGVSGKNSILLVDYTRQLMAEGMSRSEALIAAGKARLRPILMTSFALIAGTIPVAIGLNEASKMRTSMGIAIIGGMISSTILTLVVVPAAFTYIDRFRVWFESGFVRLSRKSKKAQALSHTTEHTPDHTPVPAPVNQPVTPEALPVTSHSEEDEDLLKDGQVLA